MIISPSRLKRVALEIASKRHHKFTRISREFVEKADRHLVYWVESHIASLPSKGKTIK